MDSENLTPSCSKEGKDATQQAPRHPPVPLKEAAESIAGKDTSDDGRVVEGDSRPRSDGFGGRFYFNLTGFPFPLGPLFARQTVRTEVRGHLILNNHLPALQKANMLGSISQVHQECQAVTSFRAGSGLAQMCTHQRVSMAIADMRVRMQTQHL